MYLKEIALVAHAGNGCASPDDHRLTIRATLVCPVCDTHNKVQPPGFLIRSVAVNDYRWFEWPDHHFQEVRDQICEEPVRCSGCGVSSNLGDAYKVRLREELRGPEATKRLRRMLENWPLEGTANVARQILEANLRNLERRRSPEPVA